MHPGRREGAGAQGAEKKMQGEVGATQKGEYKGKERTHTRQTQSTSPNRQPNQLYTTPRAGPQT